MARDTTAEARAASYTTVLHVATCYDITTQGVYNLLRRGVLTWHMKDIGTILVDDKFKAWVAKHQRRAV